jgi:hypothetical protein
MKRPSPPSEPPGPSRLFALASLAVAFNAAINAQSAPTPRTALLVLSATGFLFLGWRNAIRLRFSVTMVVGTLFAAYFLIYATGWLFN